MPVPVGNLGRVCVFKGTWGITQIGGLLFDRLYLVTYTRGSTLHVARNAEKRLLRCLRMKTTNFRRQNSSTLGEFDPVEQVLPS